MSGIKLKSAQRNEVRDLVAVYALSHSGPENTLDLNLVVTEDCRDGAFRASIDVESPAFDSPDAALDKLAEWLERAAAAVRARERGRCIPL